MKMIATVGGQRFKIEFAHRQFPKPEPHSRLNGAVDPVKAMTECRVVPVDEKGEPFPEGAAKAMGFSARSWCSDADNFSKETGRQVSLKRAVKDAPREVRGAILSAYFNRKGHKRGGN